MAQLEIVKNLRKEVDKLLDAEKAVAEARITFEEKERQVEKWRDEHRLLEKETTAIEQDLQSNLSRLNKEKDKLETEITTSHITSTALEEKVKEQQNNIDVKSKRIEELQNSVSIFGRLFKSASYKKAQESIVQEHEAQAQCQEQVASLNKLLDEENRKVDLLQAKRNSLTEEISEVSEELSKLYSKREKIKTKGQKIERELAIAIKKVEDQKNLLERERDKYQNRDVYERGFILDHQFISDILSTDKEISTKAQLRNPWFSERYNREREKLFLYALQMTREFILSSRKCRNNFKHLHCLWSGSYDSELVNDVWVNTNGRVKFIGDDLQSCTTAAYETLFLLIPVVSSTFASVQSQRFLGNAKEEDIVGTLIVDEAGQASPHMAIGALSRSRKAVIVGDPKQVEPVVTDDQDLLKQTYTDDLFKPYKDKTNSVQRFADIMNPYGTYLKNAQGDEEWVGCPLLVHRRCVSPMYEISNDISYSNIMKQQTAQPDPEKQRLFIAEKSQWFNVRGKEEGLKRHFVKEQGEKVIKMLEVAFSKNSSPDVFIISPFETVESGIKDYVKKYVSDCKRYGVHSYLVKHEASLNVWLSRNVGTVHKFQGREAAEVIFLLGCDTSKDSKPAIRWVNSNIVNVAATRAKYRFYVIGDKDAWEKSKCVNRAKKILDSYVAGSLGWVPQNHNPDDSYTLVIAEKLSVAKKYADALCVWNEPSNDFFEGNGYLISWCKGHLFEIATPEQYKKASIEDLPIFPDDGKYQIKYAKDICYIISIH